MEGGKDFFKNSNYFISKWAPENWMRKTSLRALWHFEDYLIPSLSTSPAKIHQNIHIYKRAYSRPRKTTQFAISRRWIPRAILCFLLISPHMSNMWAYIRKSFAYLPSSNVVSLCCFCSLVPLLYSHYTAFIYTKRSKKKEFLRF